MGPPKGRGVVVKEYIAQGQYVWEYRTYRVYPVGSEEERKLAEEYERNGEGSYVLQTAYPVPGVGCLCFEATRPGTCQTTPPGATISNQGSPST